MKIFIFSNVFYPADRAIKSGPEDILVFINRATSAPYYEHVPAARKMLFRRDCKVENFGPEIPWCENFVVGGPGNAIPESFKRDLRKRYSYDYECNDNRKRGMTTGYIVAKYIRSLYPDGEIVLVNFGFEVKKSTYRCEYHNWKFEAEDLKSMMHIYTAETVGKEEMQTVFYTLSPWLGDSLYGTAVLENLRATGKYRINVNQCHPQVWKDCPWLDRTITPESADYHIRQRNVHPWRIGAPHIIEGTTKAIEQDLGITIPIVCKLPQIYSAIPSGRIVAEKYVLINTGWQNSAETKRWSRSHWCKLVTLMPEFKFVQMGQSKNHAVPLPGCISMIDKTDFLQLCQLVRDAECVVSPPSGVIHIAGALKKPFVTIAGGREPESLIAYPSGKSLCRCGKMDCCTMRGCRLSAFGGGVRECITPAISDGQIVAQCMLDITPEEVKDAIEGLIQ